MKNITVDEIIAAGGCPLGIRSWFNDNAYRLPEGFTLREFLKNGCPYDLAVSLQDPMVDLAIKNRGHGDGQ